jgi:hypothetical protein
LRFQRFFAGLICNHIAKQPMASNPGGAFRYGSFDMEFGEPLVHFTAPIERR